ncbi:MAG TPA: RluA family pseudouridine synthase [Acidisarcina sp.]|nr:RluA family pseudouridine synthase [Acidisarcina sp.]
MSIPPERPNPQEEPQPRSWTVPQESAGQRLDQFLVQQMESVSRSRIQLLLEQNGVLVDGKPAKASLRLRGEEHISVLGEARPAPLRAIAEDIPLDIVYEDEDLAVVNKPSGMMVHAGAGATDDARNRGTLVNAILHHFRSLSTTGGDLRPGIVHRLDKETSGLIIVAKNDWAHGKLADMFAARKMSKTYLALVHGEIEKETGTVNAAISRDQVRRTRMTTKRDVGGRSAISHYQVLKRFAGRYGKFTLVAVKIETGRTHQIRVHMSSIGHPVVGDTLYGAPTRIVVPVAISGKRRTQQEPEGITLKRNFLHSAELEFAHPRSGKMLSLKSALPEELKDFLRTLDAAAEAKSRAIRA